MLLYSKGNYIQYSMIKWKRIFKKNVYICITESLCIYNLYMNQFTVKQKLTHH